MTHEATRERLAQEPDGVPTRRVAAVLGATLIVFGAAAYWSTSVLRGDTGSVRNEAHADHAGDREVGIVFQRPFDEAHATARAEKLEAAQRRLGGVGWVDKDAGVAHVPIQDAMDLVVKKGSL
jgi:hypothetical protein